VHFLGLVLFFCQQVYANGVDDGDNESLTSLTPTLQQYTESHQNHRSTPIYLSNSNKLITHSITRLHPINITNKHFDDLAINSNKYTNNNQDDDGDGAIDGDRNEEIENDASSTQMCSFHRDINNANYSIESLAGDIVVTTILHQQDNATATIKFIVNRINEINLLAYNITIGEKIIPNTLAA
jgi:hypothetical protein